MIEDRNVYYLGNQKLKKVNVPVNFTKRQLIEFSKCSNDPVYFTKKYIKIINPNKGLTSFNLWDFQEDMVSTFVNDRFTICKIPRQSGKTQTVVAVLLWYVLFHENYSIAVLAHKSSQAREILSRLQFSYEHLPKWLQQGIVEWNKGNIILENGSKIEGSATSGNSIRGKSYNCVTGDSLITIRIGDVVRNISIEKLNVLMRNNNIFNQNDILWENLNEFYRQQIYKYLLQNSREKKEKYFNKNTRQKIHDREPSYYTYMYGGKKFKREYNKFDIKRAYNITQIITEDGREKSDDLLSINFSLYHDVIGKTGNDIGTTTNKTKCLFEGIINFTSRENARKETFRGNEKENINEQYGKSNVSRINRENEIVFEGKGAWYPENKGTSNKNFSIKYGEETYAGTYKGSKSEPREDKKNSGKTSWNEKIRGVSFENEYQCQNSLPETKKIEILTRDGFKSFHGIKSLGIKKLIKIKLDNGYEIKCTKDHKILTDVGFIEAQFCVDKLISIENNCFSGVYSIKNIDEDFVYDILEVKDNNEFLCNGINVHNCVYIDEFAFVPNNIQTEFFATVLPTISAGDETKMIITSTPNGMNMFHKIWIEAVAKKNTFTPIEVHWSQIPGRDEKWKDETIRNSSLIQFQQEYNCDFLGSQNTLISSSKLQQMAVRIPLKQTEDMKIYIDPTLKANRNKLFIIVVDTSRGVGGDYNAFVIFDVSKIPYEIVGQYKNNTISPLMFPNIIHQFAKSFNDAYICVEINDNGQQVADILYREMEYENMIFSYMQGSKGQQLSSGFGAKPTVGIRTTKTVKRIGCTNFKTLVEADKLIIQDENILKELYNFIEVADSFQADVGHHDDLVMCCVIFSWLVQQQYFKDWTDTNVRERMVQDNLTLLSDDILPIMADTDDFYHTSEIQDVSYNEFLNFINS